MHKRVKEWKTLTGKQKQLAVFLFHSHNMKFQQREVQKVLSTLRNICQSFKLSPSATPARVRKKERISHPTYKTRYQTGTLKSSAKH